MASGAGEENDAVLSDVEGDDPSPIDVERLEVVSVEKFRELVSELDRERLAREAAENAKNDLQVSFNRLKFLCHEAIKKRDESSRQRDEALRERDDALTRLETVAGELSSETKLKEDAVKQQEETLKQLEELRKDRDSIRVEMETGSSMLVSGTEKLSRKVSNIKDFGGIGLPKSSKYSGFPSVAYGVIKRMNEIVEELLKQVELNVKSRNEARELVDQRNYEIAIEVSQLESTISGLREEAAKKDDEIQRFRQLSDELERQSSSQITEMETEISRLRLLVDDYDSKTKIQMPLLISQLNYVSRIHEQMCRITKILDANESPESSESLFVAGETNAEENIRASLAGLVLIHELVTLVAEKTKDVVEEKTREAKSSSESISRLVKEKEQIGSLLRSTLSQRMSNQLFEVAENGLREAGIEYSFTKVQTSEHKAALPHNQEDNEVYALAAALENIIKQSQLEIIELQHSVEELRAESKLRKEHVEAQALELNKWKQRVAELEENERVANENIEGLMMDISAAEEEILRWKAAAQQEAEAGKAVEQEYLIQLKSVYKELEEARQNVTESEKRLKFKEVTAEAAIAASDAAEKSLKLADARASRLRERVEELTRQLEDAVEGREISRTTVTNGGGGRARYVCWPWQWLGLDFVGSHVSDPPQPNAANEMELSEPLL